MTSENYQTISVLMDIPGTYKFKAKQRVDQGKKRALQPKETIAFSLIITVGIGFSLLFIFFIIFLLPKFVRKCIEWKRAKDEKKQKNEEEYDADFEPVDAGEGEAIIDDYGKEA